MHVDGPSASRRGAAQTAKEALRTIAPVVGERVLKANGAQFGRGDAHIRELEAEIADLRRELERSERRVEAMKQIGRALGSHLALDTLLIEIVSRTTDILDADRSTLFLVDRQRKELVSKVMQADEIREIRLPLGVGLAGWVATHGKPVHIKDAYTDRRFNPEVDKKSGYKTRCMLVWPVRKPRGDEVTGVLQVLNKKGGGFDETDQRLLEAIASEIGVALEVAALYRDSVARNRALERARAELSLLFETERAISQSFSLDAMLSSILETAVGSLRAKTGIIHLLDDRGLGFEVVAAHGAHKNALKRLKSAKDDKVLANVLKGGEVLRIQDDVGIERGPAKAKNLIAVPIVTSEAGTIGVLELINRKSKHGFSEDDAKALTVVASQAGRAINAERKRSERERGERLTTIGRMLSGVVHDMRTPLTLISGYTQLMSLSEAVTDREQYAHLVLKQIDLMSAMTKELLAFSRGEISVLIRKVHVLRFMSEMEEYLGREMEGTGVELSVDVRYRGAARFDETKMRRVFHNIARNAREAMPGGGKFTVTVSKRGGRLVFEFQDTGGGIPEEMEGRLFEPFSSSGKPGGTGLGLAMVKRIADEHSGTVRAESDSKGTKFIVELPLDAEKAVAAPEQV